MRRGASLLGMTGFLLAVCVVCAQPPGGFRGPGDQGSLISLLRMPEVRKELGTNDKQNKQIDELAADVQKQMQASFAGINTHDQQERQKKFDEARKKADEATKKAEEKLKQILDDKQWARLNQLQVQRQGIAAFNRAEIVKQLELTEEQQKKVRALPQGGWEREKALTDAVALLTPQQKAKWQELKGKEFKFPQMPGGFSMMQAKRALVKQFDKDKDGRLDADERKAAREAMKKDRSAGGRGGFGPGGFGPGGGFRPENLFLKPLLTALDTDKDGKVSAAELTAGIKQFFTAADKDKKGSLQEEQVAAELNRILPRPQGFPGGPPGPGPGGPPPGPPGAGPGGGPPGGPGGFGPGNFMAGNLLRQADANKDGKVSLNELTKAADKLFHEVDKNKDGKLDETELGAGIGQLMARGGPFGRENREPAKPGPHLTPAEVPSYPKASLYEPTVLRTLFLEFEGKDWEAELADFKNTDVEVPATLIVDGVKYPKVGVHFRGMSSYGMVGAGYKRSFNVKLDFANAKQQLYGYRTLNLLNSHEDSSFLSTVLYSHIARQHIPAPKANLVKVVVNGESWGVYVNVQQFNKEFLTDNYPTSKGTRWKVRGSPGGAGGLDYVGDKIEDYKRRYEIKTKDDDKAWKALIALCKTLSQTPTDKLEEALKPMLDIDNVLWFLALDVVLINNDGYWVRASDYSIYRDGKGVFHLIPHDMNEAFQGAGGFGFGPGPGGGNGARPRPPGVELDPLVGKDDVRKPLRSRLLAVPSLRARYLAYVRILAEDALDWNKLGPVVAQYRELVDKEIQADTRKLSSHDAFRKAVADTVDKEEPQGRQPSLSLRAFAEQRRRYLLNYPEVKSAVSTK